MLLFSQVFICSKPSPAYNKPFDPRLHSIPKSSKSKTHIGPWPRVLKSEASHYTLVLMIKKHTKCHFPYTSLLYQTQTNGHGLEASFHTKSDQSKTQTNGLGREASDPRPPSIPKSCNQKHIEGLGREALDPRAHSIYKSC